MQKFELDIANHSASMRAQRKTNFLSRQTEAAALYQKLHPTHPTPLRTMETRLTARRLRIRFSGTHVREMSRISTLVALLAMVALNLGFACNSLAVRPLSEQQRLTLEGSNLLGQAREGRDLDFPVVGHVDSVEGGIRGKVTGFVDGWMNR